jgi:preprotein translocase subunit SecD
VGRAGKIVLGILALILLAWGAGVFGVRVELFPRRPVGVDLWGGSGSEFTVDPPEKSDEIARLVERRLHVAIERPEASVTSRRGYVFVELPRATPERSRAMKRALETRGTFALKIVVDAEHDLGSQARLDALLAEVKEKKSSGTWRPDEPYDAVARKDGGEWLLLDNKKALSGSAIARAWPKPAEGSGPAIGFELKAEDEGAFYALTRDNVGRALAIVIDDLVYSAPVIRSAIGREGTIVGGSTGFDAEEAARLASALDTGPLPAKIELVGEVTFPPQLPSLIARIAAGAIGLLLLVGVVVASIVGKKPASVAVARVVAPPPQD